MEIGIVVALVLVVAVFFLLKLTRLGRNFYAIGGNSQSALMLGINVKRARFISYLISGLLSGIAGFVFMMLTGGVGNVIGTLFGVLTLTTIKAIVTTSGLCDPWWHSITTGAMLCFFILLQSVVLANRGKAKKRLAKG